MAHQTSLVREATHAGSWYTDNGPKLDKELTGWLSAVPDDGYPVPGCKAIIAPHAGYSYSGPTAAWAYKSIDPEGITRVFVLGPSHHYYLDTCALPRATEYTTPVGGLPLDTDTLAELRATGEFAELAHADDEAEHSIEMHLPYIRKIFARRAIRIVPVLVGALDQAREAAFGALLAPHLARADTLCVVSSDFCHWGTRFAYTHYYPEPPPSAAPAVRLGRGALPAPAHPISESIRALDHQAIDALTLPAAGGAAGAHARFAAYLRETKNTICGRHPIGVLLGALAALPGEAEVRWVRYAQSSACRTVADSSVSYASAWVRF